MERGRTIPVRVVRGYKIKHAKEYAPEEGFSYDGEYKAVKYFKVSYFEFI